MSVQSLICRHRTGSGSSMAAAGCWPSRPCLELLSCGPWKTFWVEVGSRKDLNGNVYIMTDSRSKEDCCKLEEISLLLRTCSAFCSLLRVNSRVLSGHPGHTACPSFGFTSLTWAPTFHAYSALATAKFQESARLCPASQPFYLLFFLHSHFLTSFLSHFLTSAPPSGRSLFSYAYWGLP